MFMFVCVFVCRPAASLRDIIHSQQKEAPLSPSECGRSPHATRCSSSPLIRVNGAVDVRAFVRCFEVTAAGQFTVGEHRVIGDRKRWQVDRVSESQSDFSLKKRQ